MYDDDVAKGTQTMFDDGGSQKSGSALVQELLYTEHRHPHENFPLII